MSTGRDAGKKVKLLDADAEDNAGAAVGYNTMEDPKVAVKRMQSKQILDPGLKDWDNYLSGNGNMLCPSTPSCLLSVAVPCAWLGGCVTIQENTGLVVLSNGKLAAVHTEPGLTVINPCCTSKIEISTKQQSVDLPETKVIDRKGNPVSISAIVVFRISKVIRAALEVENVNLYVRTQASAVLKEIASQYPYEPGADNGPSLKTAAESITHEMVEALQAKVSVAGVTICDFMLNELSYAPEIAGSMLVRQQAEALIDARKMIVNGAVDIARGAADALTNEGIPMSDAAKSRMVSNLICVVAGDSNVQPVLQLS